MADLKQGRISGIDHLISLRRIAGLNAIDDLGSTIRIGALVTLNQASRDRNATKYFPALADVIDSMAAYPVRTIATVVGNIAGAVPSSDLAPLLICAGAEAVLSAGDSERSVRVVDYFHGPRQTACGESEIMTHLIVPKPGLSTGMAYRKFMLRGANALAVAGVASTLALEGNGTEKIREGRIALTAVAPVPFLAREASEHLKGKRPSEAVFSKAAKIAAGEARPITDIRASREYRLQLVEVLTRRALGEALERARAKDV